MTQKVYVYIPGLEYVSKGPLHIDAIKLDVTVNQTKGSDNNINVVPVYTDITKENGQIKLTAGNVIYKSIYYPAKDTIRDDITNPTTSSHPHRAARGRYYDFLERNEETGKIKKQEDGSVKHLITFYQDSKNGYTCSNQSILEHDGLFIIELEKLNTDLILDFTFYSRINESTVSNDNIAFGEQEENPDFEKIDTTKYIEVGTWSQSYNPAISGVTQNSYKQLSYQQLYFNLKNSDWGTSEKVWEIPVNADFLVSRLDDSNYIKNNDDKNISKQYIYDQSNLIHICPENLPCNTKSATYSGFYRKFYRRLTDEYISLKNDDVADELISVPNIDIEAYTRKDTGKNGLVAIGCADFDGSKDRYFTRWHGMLLLSFGDKKYKEEIKNKIYNITYTNLDSFSYLYKNYPSVLIHNVANKSVYSDADSSRPIALCRIDDFDLVSDYTWYQSETLGNRKTANYSTSDPALTSLYYYNSTNMPTPKYNWGSTNSKSTNLRYFSNELNSLLRMGNSCREYHATIAKKGSKFNDFIVTSNQGGYNVSFELTVPGKEPYQYKSKGFVPFTAFKWNHEATESDNVGNKVLATCNACASRYNHNWSDNYSYVFSGYVNEYHYKRSFKYGKLYGYDRGGDASINNKSALLDGGETEISLKSSTQVTLTKKIKVSLPIWMVEPYLYHDIWKETETVEKEDIDTWWNDIRYTYINKYDNGVYNGAFNQLSNRYFYIFIPEMWYIDLNKSKITYNNKADYAICPMIYNDDNGLDSGSGAPAVNILPNNLLVVGGTDEFEIAQVLTELYGLSLALLSPYELRYLKVHYTYPEHIDIIDGDTSFCQDLRFILLTSQRVNKKYYFKRQNIILDPESLYVFKVSTYFKCPNAISIRISGINDSTLTTYSLTDDGYLIIYNNTKVNKQITLESLTINPDNFNQILTFQYQYHDARSETYNILSGVGLYKVNLNDTSITTLKLKSAFESLPKIVGINTDSQLIEDIIFPIAYCASEDITFCDHITLTNDRYKAAYKNRYWDEEDPIIHKYNFKYLPQEAIYLIAGFYSLPKEGNTLENSSYTSFDRSILNEKGKIPELIINKKVRQLQA